MAYRLSGRRKRTPWQWVRGWHRQTDLPRQQGLAQQGLREMEGQNIYKSKAGRDGHVTSPTEAWADGPAQSGTT